MPKTLCTVKLWLLNLAASIYIATALNLPLWVRVHELFPLGSAHSYPFYVTVFAIVVGVYFALLTLLGLLRVQRGILALLIIASAFANYFMLEYHIIIDADMVTNTLQTDPAEVRDLLSIKMVLMVFFLGALPVYALRHIRVCYPSSPRQFFACGIRTIAVLALMLACVGWQFQTLSFTVRNHKELKHIVVPANIIGGIGRLAVLELRAMFPEKPFISSNVTRNIEWEWRERPTLFVLVAGETARAQNFSLNGYERETNPELKKRDIINYAHVSSCGTSTAVSLPCMFAGLTPSSNSKYQVRHHDNLFKLMAKGGFKTLWIDNNSGCKEVCEDNQNYVTGPQLGKMQAPNPYEEIYDTTMIKALLQNVKDDDLEDHFVVMHQKGSHGPAYYKRVPKEFAKFQPECDKNRLQDCSAESLTNSYDNTVLFTDYFLAQLIDTLQANYPEHDTAMLYVSDHGESLGEKGLYLHGMPYMVAPEEQTHVPMVLWMSDRFKEGFHIDMECMKDRADENLSHQNLFHTVLSALELESPALNKNLSLFDGCETMLRSSIVRNSSRHAPLAIQQNAPKETDHHNKL